MGTVAGRALAAVERVLYLGGIVKWGSKLGIQKIV
jgi:hypothetical protein